MNVLVTGANGQLGTCLKDASTDHSDLNISFKNVHELDITDRNAIEKTIVDNSIDAVINCAAFTAVDLAETEKEKAYQVNETAVRYLAELSKAHNYKLIHFSTDYVFEGSSEQPYQPEDSTNPQAIYGASKAAGERAILEADANAIIVRTAWVYSEYGKNFFKTMMRLGVEKESLNVVNDQIGCPTYAYDLAKASLIILKKEQNWNNKIYHYCNLGKISWYDFAAAIMETAGFDCAIHPIPSSEYPTPAKRPAFSLLATEKISNDFDLDIPQWKSSLKDCYDKFIRIKDKE